MTRSTRTVVALLLLASLLAIGVLFTRDLTTLYVARELETASADEELSAARRFDQWGHRGWLRGAELQAEDAQGREIRPWRTGDWDAVKTVVVLFDNGVQVRRTIEDRRSLQALFAH